jgi:hypothetical protein
MKNFKKVLPLFAMMLAVICAFAFKAAPAQNNLEKGWYVLTLNADPTLPSSYTFDADYNPMSEGCVGDDEICAIHAEGNGVEPNISGNPETDPNVDDVDKREL